MVVNGDIHAKVLSIWEKWPQIKHTTHLFGFREYISANYGFTYKPATVMTENGAQQKLVIDKIVDEEKFTWFLLQC